MGVVDFLNIVSPPAWMEDAACAEVGGDEWFPEKGGSGRPAKQVCAGCPVQAQCLAYALEHDERFGVWGGLTEPERERLKSSGGWWCRSSARLRRRCATGSPRYAD